MTTVFQARYGELLDKPAVLNPTFDGSVEIDGTDADLIVGGVLIELKTTKLEKFERLDHLCQLLGYALLDYSDGYGIGAVGVYLARRGLFVEWEIAELLSASNGSATWADMQREFRDAVARSNTRRLRSVETP